MNFALEIEKILCYYWFPTKGAESDKRANAGECAEPAFPQTVGPMDTRVFCVYNLARGVFLSSKVTVADCANQPLMILKVFVSGLAVDADTSFWLSPLNAKPAVPRLFPFDLVYLDKDHRVVEAAEIHPGVDFPPYRREVASALVLPSLIVQSTQTENGDRLIICPENELEEQIASVVDAHARDIPAMGPKPAGGRPSESLPAAQIEPSLSRGVLAAPVSSAAIATAQSAVAVKNSDLHETVVAPAVSYPGTNGQKLAKPSPEIEINAVKARDADPVELVPAATDRRKKARSVSSAVGSPTLIADQGAETRAAPITSAKTPLATGAISTDLPAKEATSSDPAETPVMSITEVILERSRSEQSIITGHHGGVEDLFSNWVDSPSLAAAWIARNAELEGSSVHAPAGAPPDPPSLGSEKAGKTAIDSKLSISQAAPEPGTSSQHTVKTQADAATWRESMPALPEVSGPTAISSPP